MSHASDNSEPLITSSKHPVSSAKPFSMRLFAFVCPCLFSRKSNDANQRTNEAQGVDDAHIQSLQSEGQTNPGASKDQTQSSRKQLTPAYKSALEGRKAQGSEEITSRRKSNDFRMNCPVLRLPEDTLMVLGATTKMLVHITTAKVMPEQHVLERTRKLIESSANNRSLFRNPKLDFFWNRRYLLFERFDYGIQLDEDSWFSALPEAVTQHLAKRISCTTALVSQCGVGCEALRFARYCHQVYAMDSNPIKLEHLQTNAAICGVDNLRILQQDFLDVPEVRADFVYMSFSKYTSQEVENTLIDLEQDIRPKLSQLLRKALSIAPNVVLLFPINISEQQLVDIFGRTLLQLPEKRSSCCLELEKVYFISGLKYIVVYYGPLANCNIKLSDELDFLYTLADPNAQQPQGEVRRLIKELRERLGMVTVLQCLLDCRRFYKNVRLADRLCDYIRDKRMLSVPLIEGILKKTKSQQTSVQTMQQQKFDGEGSQRTESYYTSDMESYRSSSLTNNLRRTIHYRFEEKTD